MNKTHIAMMSAAMLIASCTGGTDTQADGTVIGRQEITVEGGRLTPEALWAMGRIGSAAVSPDAQKIAYTVSYYSVPENRSHNVIYLMNADGSGNTLLTQGAGNEGSPCWIKGGAKLAYLSAANGKSEVWEMNPDGTGRTMIASYDGGDIEGFAFSPDEKKLLFIAQVKYGQTTADIYPDLPLASGRIVNDLMYKHWDEWVSSIPHPFVADFDGKAISGVTDLLEGEPYESPMKPFGGIEQLAWSPDSKTIAYTCRKKTGKAYALSTDSDIYLYDIATRKTVNLCKAEGEADQNMGYDTNPQFSPDGQYVAWQSMARDGYESDRNRLCTYNLADGTKRYVTESFDSGVDSYCWGSDSRSLYFTGVWHATKMVYSTDLEGNVKKLTEGTYDYEGVSLMGNRLLCKRHSMSTPDDLYAINPENGEATQLTRENKHILDQIEMGRVEERWMKTTDGKEMLVWIIYPPQFDPAKKYPTLLYCEGGPQSPVSQFWSYRWNFQMMAANDYIIVAPNRRGLPGFGSEWLEEISGDYGGQCMKDYLTAIDTFASEPFVDRDHLGCVGASFGGFSVYWLAGHHDGRFKAFIAHDGIFNIEQQYLETEEMWFANWDMGGAYWDRSNAVAQRTFANSPHKFVDRWDTPILCIHGEKDYRILASQGMSAFNAAILRGIPAQLLIYPDENHWVLRPQNGILWQRTFFAWLDRWLKE